MSKLLRQDEVCEILGLRPSTLENWRHLGKGPEFIKVGGAVRYDADALAAWIDSSRVEAGAR